MPGSTVAGSLSSTGLSCKTCFTMIFCNIPGIDQQTFNSTLIYVFKVFRRMSNSPATASLDIPRYIKPMKVPIVALQSSNQLRQQIRLIPPTIASQLSRPLPVHKLFTPALRPFKFLFFVRISCRRRASRNSAKSRHSAHKDNYESP